QHSYRAAAGLRARQRFEADPPLLSRRSGRDQSRHGGGGEPGQTAIKIERAYTIVTCPGRNFVTLKIVTADGVHGVGDATLNGRELAVRAYLDEHVIPCLIGRDPRNIEDCWQYLYRGAYWRRGPVTMAAIAAVDMALWDIVGKIARLPVY